MISEIDLKDFTRSEQTVPLYEVPCKSVCSLWEAPTAAFTFDHLDGMYSVCYNKRSELFHLFASTDVYIWKEICEFN